MRRVIISIHGIRTRGAWQKELNPPLQEAGYDHWQLDYGWRGVFQILWRRKRLIKRFLEDLGRIPDHPENPSVIAHSFGSYLIAKALEMYPSDVKFDRVILCGSIVRSDYPWTDKIRSKQINYVLHEYGEKDVWPKYADYVIKDAGPSGTKGFTDEANGKVIQLRYPDLGHSDFFWVPHVKKVWIPFLLGKTPEKYDHKNPNPPNIKPFVISLLFALIVVVSVALLYSTIYGLPESLSSLMKSIVPSPSPPGPLRPPQSVDVKTQKCPHGGQQLIDGKCLIWKDTKKELHFFTGEVYYDPIENTSEPCPDKPYGTYIEELKDDKTKSTTRCIIRHTFGLPMSFSMSTPGHWNLYYRAYTSTAENRIDEKKGWDRYGDDYRDFDKASLPQCREECLADDQCRAFTWHSFTNHCWLKSDIPNEEIRRDYVTTGVKVPAH